MFRLRSIVAHVGKAGSTGLFLALLAQPAVPGECFGVARRVWLGDIVWSLTCYPEDCTEGCTQVQVTTPNGPGHMCQCNYVGPHPNCCALVVLNNGDLSSTGGLTTVGVCGDPGCPPETGTCHIQVRQGNMGGGGFPYEAACGAVPP